MMVRVRLFAMLRERAGTPELELDLPDGARVADALAEVGHLAPGIPLVMAVNRRYADSEQALSAGDELALIPPVSGGAATDVYARLTEAALSLDDLLAAVRDPRAGAVVTFQGVTREVDRLEYEAYAEMAEVRLREIAAAAAARHPVCRVAVEHRLGAVPLSEPSVAVAASAPHRPAAFAAAREIIDAVKAQAPIWKREVEGEVAEWVTGIPPTPDAPAGLSERLRELPSVELLADQLARGEDRDRVTIAVAREVVDRRRALLLAGQEPDGELLDEARRALAQARNPGPVRVVNATGVIVHTNLGRAPLAASARAAVARVAEGYSDLELDLAGGARGSRQAHVRELLRSLTGAEDALAVNNGAGAVLLAAAALAGPGRSVIVSRGQLIEIGGSFRIPEVIAASGSRLVEVGTTNRTRLSDYERALAAERAHGRTVGAILRAHQSNFRTVGFVEEVATRELCGLGPPVIDDVGSGALAEIAEEPLVAASVAAGAALVCFSGDKLLGGPQAGLLVGRADAVARAARHPLARALRIDKLSLAALSATLALHRDPQRARREIPVLAMLEVSPAHLRGRADRLAEALTAGGLDARVIDSTARVGGGALPLLELEGPAVRIQPPPGGADAAAAALRHARPPVLARIADGGLVLDPRTMSDADAQAAAQSVVVALSR